MFRTLRYVVWLPFAVVSNIPFFIALNVAMYIYATPGWFYLVLFWSLVLGGLAMPFEAQLRPLKQSNAKLPPRERPIVPSLALIAVKAKGRAPKLRAIARQLTPELRALLTTKAGEPEAITHDRRLLASQEAQ